MTRKEWKRQRDAVILLQTQTRGMLARRALNKKKRNVSVENNGELWRFVWCRGCCCCANQNTGFYSTKISFAFRSPSRSFFCVPFLQMYLSAKQREEEQRALLVRQAHLEEVLRQAKEAKSDSITDQEMVDTIFNFLPPLINKQEGPAGSEVGSLQSFTHSEFKVSDCMFPFVVRILKGEG